ncbi:MAG: zinc-dependent metalloprotease [Alistipes senegalensis]
MFKIETFTPDSSAVVVDATNLFVSDDERLLPFDKYSQHTLSGRLKRKESFEKEKSYVTGIKSFSDNVSVSSSLNYRVTISERGLRDVPVTIAATRSILLLDSLPVSPRITDSRIAVFPTGKMLYSPTTQGARPIWYANRWRLEPSDIEAYRRGELVDPVKPIVFYIDRNFPRTWLPYVIEGVNQWSELFEQIGFRNAVQARLFPEDDPEFDPDNLKYSCVRYAPVTIQNAMGPSWTDPRSGEIVSASVYLYHDVIELINNWLFIQTSPADPRVRQRQIPQEIIGDALRYVLSHEIGHCLGFMHNMGASSVIPVDSLRSPLFTRETGTTPSIMDCARFNYVAERAIRARRADDASALRVYDRFLVKWNYTPLFAGSPEAEYAITSRWLREASADPALRYGRTAQFSEPLDPRSLSRGSWRRSRQGFRIRHLQSEIRAFAPQCLDRIRRPGLQLPQDHLQRNRQPVFHLSEPCLCRRGRSVSVRETRRGLGRTLPERSLRASGPGVGIPVGTARRHGVAGRPECDGQSGAGGLGRGRRVRGCDESRRGVALESGAFGCAGRERRLHARSVHVVDLRPDLGLRPFAGRR